MVNGERYLYIPTNITYSASGRNDMAIAIARKSEGPSKLKNGYGQIEWLQSVHPLVHSFKCVLKAGHSVTPSTYADKTVVYIFGHGTGYITNSQRAYNITEISFFVPDFDKDNYSIFATTDMEYMLIVTDMLQSDLDGYTNTHMCLPYFKKLSDADEYTQSCKGPNTKSWSIIHSGQLARVLMGVVKAEGDGEGTVEKGHPAVDQWNYALPGADFILHVEDEQIEQFDGEWSFVPAGLDHSLVSAPGKSVFYVWFEHKTAEIETGRH